MSKKSYLILGISILIILLTYFGVSLYVASQVVARNNRELTVRAEQISSDYQNITFTTADNIELKGWFFPSSREGLVILVSGYGNTRVNDDYNGPGLMRDLLAEGYAVLVYDARGVGESGGPHITQADHEWGDARAAIDYAIETKQYRAQDIALIASSMGATTVADNINKFKDVGAVVLDSPAKRFSEPVSLVLARDNGIPGFVHPGVFLAAKLVYKIDIPSVRPIDNITSDPDRELLFLHAVQDNLIPVQDSRDILARSNPKSRLVEFKSGGHVRTYAESPELYLREVFSFLEVQLTN